MEKYELHVAGLTRQLPIMPISDELSIAGFVILGDVELVKRTSAELAPKLPAVDYLVTAETKGIPLVHEIASLLDMSRYVVARKSVKSYMTNPIIREVQSITTPGKQLICLDSTDAELLKGKRVAIVDDVISTGASVKVLEDLITSVGGEVVARVAILAEGEVAQAREDIVYLEKLPLFFTPHPTVL